MYATEFVKHFELWFVFYQTFRDWSLWKWRFGKRPSTSDVGPFFKFYDPPHCPCRFSLPLEMSFLKSFSPPCKNLHVCCISCTYFQWIWQKKLSQFFQLKYGSNRKNDSTIGILKCQVSSEFKAFWGSQKYFRRISEHYGGQKLRWLCSKQVPIFSAYHWLEEGPPPSPSEETSFMDGL